MSLVLQSAKGRPGARCRLNFIAVHNLSWMSARQFRISGTFFGPAARKRKSHTQVRTNWRVGRPQRLTSKSATRFSLYLIFRYLLANY